MPDKFEEGLERRLDQLDAWHQSEDAVRRAASEAKADRRFKLQAAFSLLNAASVLINVYLSVFPRK